MHISCGGDSKIYSPKLGINKFCPIFWQNVCYVYRPFFYQNGLRTRGTEKHDLAFQFWYFYSSFLSGYSVLLLSFMFVVFTSLSVICLLQFVSFRHKCIYENLVRLEVYWEWFSAHVFLRAFKSFSGILINLHNQ